MLSLKVVGLVSLIERIVPFVEAVVDTKFKRQLGLIGSYGRFSQRKGQISQQISSRSNIHCIPIPCQGNVARIPVTKPFMMFTGQDNVLRSTLGKDLGPLVWSVQSCIKAMRIFRIRKFRRLC